MGNCSGSDSSSKEQHQAHDRIERLLKQEKMKHARNFKMLLLGTGDSGKSTIAKQMRIIYLSGFPPEERKKWKAIIHSNIISYIKILIIQMHKFDLSYENPTNNDHEMHFLRIDDMESSILTMDHAEMVMSLWNDKSIQATWERNAEFQICDSASYFFLKAKDFAQMDYVVSDEDVLMTRVKTTGIVEVEFEVDNELFKMVDVGGQRSERKKWIHCFQDVAAVLFVVALNEYNLMLEENSNINRMMESLKLFDDMINNMWFKTTNVILFLNKTDLFEEKIKKIDPKVCFPNYTGGMKSQVAMEYIENQYKQRNKFPERGIFPHFTCATDTDNIKHVWAVAKKILLQEVIDLLMPM